MAEGPSAAFPRTQRGRTLHTDHLSALARAHLHAIFLPPVVKETLSLPFLFLVSFFFSLSSSSRPSPTGMLATQRPRRLSAPRARCPAHYVIKRSHKLYNKALPVRTLSPTFFMREALSTERRRRRNAVGRVLGITICIINNALLHFVFLLTDLDLHEPHRALKIASHRRSKGGGEQGRLQSRSLEVLRARETEPETRESLRGRRGQAHPHLCSVVHLLRQCRPRSASTFTFAIRPEKIILGLRLQPKGFMPFSARAKQGGSPRVRLTLTGDSFGFKRIFFLKTYVRSTKLTVNLMGITNAHGHFSRSIIRLNSRAMSQ